MRPCRNDWVCHRYEQNAVFCGRLLLYLSEAFRPAGGREPFCASSRAVPPDSIVNGIGTLLAVAPGGAGQCTAADAAAVRRDARHSAKNTIGQKRGIVRQKARRAAGRNGKIAQHGGRCARSCANLRFGDEPAPSPRAGARSGRYRSSISITMAACCAMRAASASVDSEPWAAETLCRS